MHGPDKGENKLDASTHSQTALRDKRRAGFESSQNPDRDDTASVAHSTAGTALAGASTATAAAAVAASSAAVADSTPAPALLMMNTQSPHKKITTYPRPRPLTKCTCLVNTRHTQTDHRNTLT